MHDTTRGRDVVELTLSGVTRLNIQPTDLQTQDYGAFAVVSFHLRGNDNIGRRSIVMRRDEQGWRIVHFHASALEQSP